MTALQDNYFHGGTAKQLMAQITARPDSVFVSAETVTDFQLRPGDNLNLRIQDARTHQLKTIGFHYIGIVAEFPTAPKDSFFVANASYIARQTGSAAVGAFLVDTGGRDTTAVAARIQAALGTSATVTDIATSRGTVGSSLTVANLAGLTRIELGFGVVLATASGPWSSHWSWPSGAATSPSPTPSAPPARVRPGRSHHPHRLWPGHRLHPHGGAVPDFGAYPDRRVRPAPTTLAVPWIYLSTTAALMIATIGAVSAITVGLARKSPLAALADL